MRHRYRVTLVAGVTAIASALLAAPARAGGSDHHTWTVHPGTGTVAAAVAKAHDGDTLLLKAGTFHDSVIITKSLTIRGAGWDKTTVRPPSSNAGCNVMGGIHGFCLFGATDSKFNPIFSDRLEDASVSHMRFTGFSGIGVVGFNTDHLSVTHVRSDHNGQYGIARFASIHSVFAHDSASWDGEAGLYLGDSPNGDSVVRDSWSDHSTFGIFLRDSTELTARDNHVWGNCVGLMALNTGGEAPFDIPAGDYRITGNTVWANDKACPAGEDGPALSGLGILLAGVHDSVVRDNTVNNNKPGGPTLGSGGIAIVSTKSMHGTDPTNNTVADNKAHHNVPADIVWDKTGSGNVVRGNDCAKAIPDNLGWCHQ